MVNGEWGEEKEGGPTGDVTEDFKAGIKVTCCIGTEELLSNRLKSKEDC